MRKCKDAKVSMQIGKSLREMMEGLKGESRIPIIPYKALPLSPEKIEEGRKIMERLKMRLHNPVPKPLYPLPRDPKTGRMMKAERRI